MRSLLSAVAVNAAAGTLFAWSVLLPALSTELGRPADDLGVVFSGALVVFAAAVLLGGPFVDRQGPARGAAVAAVLAGVGLAVAAAAPGLAVLVAGFGGLFGCGSGLAYLSAVAWASTDRGRGTGAVGVVVAAYAAGPVAAAPFGTLGVDRWGWRTTLVVAAVVVSVVMLVASRGLPGPPSRPGVRAGGRASGPVGDAVALTALWLLFFGTVAPALLAFGYGAQIATERGVSADTAGVVVALMALGNVAGRLLPALLWLRLGVRGALWSALLLLVPVLAALAWAPSAAVGVLGLPLVALPYGMVSALLPTATAEVAPERRFGTAYGRVFSSFGVAAVVGPVLGALLHAEADGYAAGFRASLVCAGVAVVALAVYHRRTSAAFVDVPHRRSRPH